ncbi:hypothetical protein GQX74_014969 [Glossina fuscipes]|nr:hypothetical protein GQX74_014969 [Glossina fuscipes]
MKREKKIVTPCQEAINSMGMKEQAIKSLPPLTALTTLLLNTEDLRDFTTSYFDQFLGISYYVLLVACLISARLLSCLYGHGGSGDSLPKAAIFPMGNLDNMNVERIIDDRNRITEATVTITSLPSLLQFRNSQKC